MLMRFLFTKYSVMKSRQTAKMMIKSRFILFAEFILEILLVGKVGEAGHDADAG